MNKTAIIDFVNSAKEALENAVKLKAYEYGVTENGAVKGQEVVHGKVLSEIEKSQRDALIRTIESAEDKQGFEHGFHQIVEEAAYTWFNRFIALRFMEVNGFLPSHTRVFSDENGKFAPQILKEATIVSLDGIDRVKVFDLIQRQKNEELFKYLIILQCNELSKPMPEMFERISDYTELLFPNGLLNKDSVIAQMVENIPEEDWKDQVQIIGWMYQFYISKKKDEAFAAKKTITKDTLPAVTQLFTPDWIVKYMAENSVGRIWLESNPNSPLKSQMKYYVDDAKQEADVQQKLEAIQYKNVSPEQIKIIEPCCGSGHILVYVFDLLYKMYEEKGYQPREIPTLILSNNIVGLDVDKRAAQLASFSLAMKARTLNPRFFSDRYYAKPQIYEILDSQILIRADYKKYLEESHKFSEIQIKQVDWLVETFKNAKTIGSLLKIEKRDFLAIGNIVNSIRDKITNNLFIQDFYGEGVGRLNYLLKLAEILSRDYDVMITNPPYIGISSMEKEVKDYAAKYYPDSKSDMFAMFMEAPLVKRNGFRAMINMHSWMFLSSYEKLRKKIIMNEMIVNMVHLGAHAFETIGGEVVQTTAFVLRNAPIATNGVYFRLVDEKDKEKAFLEGGGLIMNIEAYKSIPSNSFAYWLSANTINNFSKSSPLSSFADARNGFTTGNNDLFLRMWFEVRCSDICFGAPDSIFAFYTGNKWFPYNKGGEFRKWYGNQEYVINWQGDGKDIKKYGHLVPRSYNYMFFESISWSKISSGNISFRHFPKGFMFDVAGLSLFVKTESTVNDMQILAFLNSSVCQFYLNAMSPTLNFETGQISNLPMKKTISDDAKKLAKKSIENAKKDWDSFETSWDFKKHPLA